MSFVISYSVAARELGVSHQTVSDMVRLLGITPKPNPTNGRAKGIDREDFERLRGAIEGMVVAAGEAR